MLPLPARPDPDETAIPLPLQKRLIPARDPARKRAKQSPYGRQTRADPARKARATGTKDGKNENLQVLKRGYCYALLASPFFTSGTATI